MKQDFLYPLRKLHGRFYEWRLFKKEKRSLKKKYLRKIRNCFCKNPQSVILVLTPQHSNLGDHAIAIAEIKMLTDLGIPYVEITGKELALLQKYGLLSIMNGYPIIINGGGNLGTLWPYAELLMRDIVRFNSKSTIAIMPNTIYYEKSDWGKEEYNNSKKIYNAHCKLYMYSREQSSYDIMHNSYNNVKLIPDVVLSLNETKETVVRNGCLLCLRSDCEKTITSEEEHILKSQVESLFADNYRYSDTHAPSAVPIELRTHALETKLEEFRTSELVITDRLHGMIFAAITGTPCIVINSKSPKVKGCYDWIKDLGYIRFVDNANQITKAYASIPKCSHRYNNEHLLPYFDKLKQDIFNIVKGE